MASVALTGIVGENPIHVAHVQTRRFTTQPGSNVTPIVFVVVDDASVRFPALNLSLSDPR